MFYANISIFSHINVLVSGKLKKYLAFRSTLTIFAVQFIIMADEPTKICPGEQTLTA